MAEWMNEAHGAFLDRGDQKKKKENHILFSFFRHTTGRERAEQGRGIDFFS